MLKINSVARGRENIVFCCLATVICNKIQKILIKIITQELITQEIITKNWFHDVPHTYILQDNDLEWFCIYQSYNSTEQNWVVGVLYIFFFLF